MTRKEREREFERLMEPLMEKAKAETELAAKFSEDEVLTWLTTGGQVWSNTPTQWVARAKGGYPVRGTTPSYAVRHAMAWEAQP